MDENWANRRWLLAEIYPYAAFSLHIHNHKHNERKGDETKNTQQMNGLEWNGMVLRDEGRKSSRFGEAGYVNGSS